MHLSPSYNAVTAAIPQLSVKGTAAGQNQQRSTYVSIKCVCGFFSKRQIFIPSRCVHSGDSTNEKY